MKELRETLINKSNIHKVNTSILLKNPKKKDISVGCLCMIGTGEVGMVINQNINKNLDIFSGREVAKKDFLIAFAEDGWGLSPFSYIALDNLDNNLKDRGGEDDWCVKAMYIQSPPKNVFDSKDTLWSYLKNLDIEKYFQ